MMWSRRHGGDSFSDLGPLQARFSLWLIRQAIICNRYPLRARREWPRFLTAVKGLPREKGLRDRSDLRAIGLNRRLVQTALDRRHMSRPVHGSASLRMQLAVRRRAIRLSALRSVKGCARKIQEYLATKLPGAQESGRHWSVLPNKKVPARHLQASSISYIHET